MADKNHEDAVADDTGDEEVRAAGEAPREYTPKHSLRAVVVAVTAVALLAAGAAFFWLAWLLSGASAPWASNGVDWLATVKPEQWLNAAISATALVLTLCAAVFTALAVRKQDVTERAFDFNAAVHETALEQLEVSADAQRTAEWRAEIAQAQGDIDRQRLMLESERLRIERDAHRSHTENALRRRFTEAAGLLASEQVPVRLAGVYALASLADDWHDFGDDAERQMCVSLLCDQLRLTPATPAEFEVHRSIVALIRAHRPTEEVKGAAAWTDCELDLTGAYIPGVNLIDTDLNGATLFRANLSGSSLANSVLTDVSATYADLDRANLVGVEARCADLRWAKLTNCLVTGSDLSRADLRHADFSGSDLTKARLGAADVSGAVLETANLSEARTEDLVSDAATKWPTSSGYVA